MGVTLNIEEIKKIIPHRDPILLVDEVVDMSEDTIITKLYINPKIDIFRGHFPEDPVFPGVYTVEAMAQTADILILSMERYIGKTPLFIGIDQVKFLNKIKPGNTIKIMAKLTTEKIEKGIVTCAVEVFVDEMKACIGNVALAMR